MKSLNPITVTESLLNEVKTLAAPAMLGMALRAALDELGERAPSFAPYRFSAEFRQGAQLGDGVRIAIEESDETTPGNRAFGVLFSKGDNDDGRVGKWRLIFAERQAGAPLPYAFAHHSADGRTDRELWRPEAMIATGDFVEDAQSLLWLMGQSARAYHKRLDQEFIAGAPNLNLQDEPDGRRYAGIAVTATVIRWPAAGAALGCAVDCQLPLNRQTPSKKMDFPEALVATTNGETVLLGTASFTVARLSARGSAVLPDGSSG